MFRSYFKGLRESFSDEFRPPEQGMDSDGSKMSLIRALDKLDHDETNRILETMPSEVSIRDEDERVALHYAAEICDLETFQRIFDQNPALLDCADKNGHTPFLNALMSGRLDVAEFLASKGANVHHVDKEGHNAVHWATVCGQLEALNWVVSKNVEVNSPDFTQNACAVHYATVSDDVAWEMALSVLVSLLNHGAHPNARDKDLRTPILWCASNGNVQAMNALRQAGGDMLAKDRDRLGVLHCAASHGYHEVIDLAMECISRGVVEDEDRAGHTALFYAVTFGHYESALKLLQYGANPNHQDQRLRTPTHCAASKGQMRMLKLLKQHNASFDIQNYRGDMPFHESVQTGSKDVVEWLLALDPSCLDAPNHQGRTALHLAAAAGNLEMVIFLCGKQCFVNPLMLYKGSIYTPLDIAKKQKHDVVVEYLSQQHKAQSSEQMSPEELEKWRVSFEEQIVQGNQAKLERGRKIAESQEKGDEVAKISKRRGSSAENRRTDVAVNTSARQLTSADSNVRVALTKATSTTQLADSSPVDRNDRKSSVDIFNIDDFENLPAISDESEPEDRTKDHEKENQNGKRRSKSLPKLGKDKEKPAKEVHIRKDESETDGRKSNIKKETNKDSGNKLVMRVRREPEVGNDGGDFDIYEDDWEHVPRTQAQRSFGKDASRKYVHEKAIFQELTHLKRMQIQYGKVQERILVRSLVANFCKMHGLDPAHFKFHTFYAWEKFLYEQLKTIYMDERDRLSQARIGVAGAAKGDKFGSRLRRSLPFSAPAKAVVVGRRHEKDKEPQQRIFDGQRRCDCLDKHLLIQN